jgi:hypothetical protein
MNKNKILDNPSHTTKNPHTESALPHHSIKDISGNVYGKLTVLSYYGSSHQGTQATKGSMWLCKCECGVELPVLKRKLISGDKKSCGCKANKIHRREIGEYEGFYFEYMKNALKTKKSFAITKKEFLSLVLQNCHYCGTKPRDRKIPNTHSKTAPIGGLDRKDSSIGYEFSNLLPCCTNCNYAKKERSYDEFISWIQKIKSFHPSDSCGADDSFISPESDLQLEGHESEVPILNLTHSTPRTFL